MNRLRPGLHTRLMVLLVVSGAPAVAVASVCIFRSEAGSGTRWLLLLLVFGVWIGATSIASAQNRYHLRTVSNLLAALREGDFSFRARTVSRSDPHGEVIAELNLLAETLRRQRVEGLEAAALVRKVMAEIDVAVLAFDSSNRVRQVNAAGEQIFGERSRLLGMQASELGLEACLSGPSACSVELVIAGSARRWEVRRGSYREHGRPNHLLVLSDVSRTLQAEELAAWKRLIRVLGHELNNSLAPITSLAGSLERLVDQDPLPADWRTDLGRGLGVIASRVAALNRFMSDCARLARLPQPTLVPVDLGACVRKVAALEERLPVHVEGGPDLCVAADQDQLEQVLINLVKNAVDACLENDGQVTVCWRAEGGMAEVEVCDSGPGLPESANLFVPFHTTKENGSGIGLFLCRQIAEAHGGAVSVEDRKDGSGCRALLSLPLASAMTPVNECPGPQIGGQDPD